MRGRHRRGPPSSASAWPGAGRRLRLGRRGRTASAAASPRRGTITVLAAASLTEAFTTLGQQFEAAHPGVKVTFGFAGSSALATQITSGAPADVFASASTKNMDAVVAAGAAADPAVFAENTMEIAVPPSNPGKVTGVDVAGVPGREDGAVPASGAVRRDGAKVFTNAGVTVKPVTLEPDVKSVLSKVQLGEVDAGVVYVTDVLAAGDEVAGVEIPADVNASTSYPIAALTGAPTPRPPPRSSTTCSRRRAAGADRGRLPAAVTVATLRAAASARRRERARRAARSAPAAARARARRRSLFLVCPWRAGAPGALGRAGRSCTAAGARRSSSRCGTSTVATAISLVVGVPLAWVLARTEFPGLRLVRALVTLPLVLPPVVGGVALLSRSGRNGFVGQYLDQWFGITIPFTPAAVVWPRRSWRCRSSSSRSRARCARPTVASRRPPPPWARRG